MMFRVGIFDIEVRTSLTTITTVCVFCVFQNQGGTTHGHAVYHGFNNNNTDVVQQFVQCCWVETCI